MERFDDQALARGPALVWVRYDVADQPLTVILVSAFGRSVKKKRSLNLSLIWTHPGLQGQFRVTARRITTARIYTACYVRTRCLPALMASALSLLHSLTTSAGLCSTQGLEEPVVPVVPARWHGPRHRLGGTPLCGVALLRLWTTRGCPMTRRGANAPPAPIKPRRRGPSSWLGPRWHRAALAGLCPPGASDSGDPSCGRRPAAPHGPHG